MKKYHRRSIRLKQYHYGESGWYFVTICTFERRCTLGNVVNERMCLNEWGEIVENEWIRSADIRNEIELDEYVVSINATRPVKTHVWQRNYCERVIRNETELYETRKYIHDNPSQWFRDRNHPDRC